MTTKQDKKNTPLFSGGRPGTQEDCNRINNGGATQIVLTRRGKDLATNRYKSLSTQVYKEHRSSDDVETPPHLKFIEEHEKYKFCVFNNGMDIQNTDEDDLDTIFEFFEMTNPSDAVLVTQFEEMLESWTGWHIEKYYYVCRVPTEEKTFLLFMISWDDNWGRYEKFTCAAITGCETHTEAKVHLLRKFAHERLPDADSDEYEYFLRTLL